uniref:Transcription initiation factor IIF subunit alpha n=1 Tax=Rhabditophanes sp. KR3021 TaxID=114890 RepID=A0AC35TTT4_9BILA
MSGRNLTGNASLKSVGIRVATLKPDMKQCILKFNSGTNSEVSDIFTRPGSVINFDREDNRVQSKYEMEQMPEFGAGSEYGRAEREEARRKKLGRRARNFNLDNQAWNLRVDRKEKVDGKEVVKTKKFKTIKEGSTNTHCDYWIFVKHGDEFLATCVDDFYQVMPAIPYRTLDAEEAELQFLNRDKMINKFAFKAQLSKQNEDNEGDEKIVKEKHGLVIKDEASDASEDGEDEDTPGTSTDRTKKKKKKFDADVERKKDKRVKVQYSDEVAKYDSEDGDDEGREYDYMSDSGSDTDKEDVPDTDKIEGALVGVAEEYEGKDGENESDSDEENEEDKEKPAKKEDGDSDSEKATNGKKRKQEVKEDSSNDDSDYDEEDMDAYFDKGLKRGNTSSLNGGSEAKKSKIEIKSPVSVGEDAITEEALRNILRNRECHTKELVNHFKSTMGLNIEKRDVVTKMSKIMKEMPLIKRRETVKGKEVVFFRLKD